MTREPVHWAGLATAARGIAAMPCLAIARCMYVRYPHIETPPPSIEGWPHGVKPEFQLFSLQTNLRLESGAESLLIRIHARQLGHA